MYVQKGYAGNRLLYVKGKEQEGENNNYTRYTQDDWFNDQGKGRWILKRVEREDTDILYYDLGALEVFTTLRGLNTFRPGQNSIIWHQTEAGTAR